MKKYVVIAILLLAVVGGSGAMATWPAAGLSGISKIQWKDSAGAWHDGGTNVEVGDSLTFRAVKDSPSLPWPSNEPDWVAENGFTARGEQTSITFGTRSTPAHPASKVYCSAGMANYIWNTVSVSIGVLKGFSVTTYYTPIEASFTGSRAMHFGENVKSDWWSEVTTEGWGKLDSTHGSHSGMYLCFDGTLSSSPKGNGSRVLSAGSSLATDHSIIPLDNPATFTLTSPSTTNGGIGSGIYGTAVDSGGAIGGYHIDLYVGDRNKAGTGAGAYVADSWSKLLVLY